MTRLPIPKGDLNSWDTILNDFLGVAHNSDGTLKYTIVTKVASDSPYTILATDVIILGNAVSGAITVTLPTAVGIPGKVYIIKKTDSSSNAVTVATTSSQTIDGSTTKILPAQYNSVQVISDGANWIIIPGFVVLSANGAHSVQITHDNTNALIVTDTGEIRLKPGASSKVAVHDTVNGEVAFFDQHGNVYLDGGLNSGTGLYYTSNMTPQSLATGDTINAQGVALLAFAPTGNVTGIIMQAGYPGQVCTVINKSAFTITFAAAGTSGVADGTLAVIAANRAMSFQWNSDDSKWYRT
jgi:hypothetical protein